MILRLTHDDMFARNFCAVLGVCCHVDMAVHRVGDYRTAPLALHGTTANDMVAKREQETHPRDFIS